MSLSTPSGGSASEGRTISRGDVAHLAKLARLAVTELGVHPQRVDTIIDFPAIERFGVKFEGNADAANAAVLAELAELVVAGELEVPIAEVYPLDQVKEAYRSLEQRHTRGKIVLRP